MILDKTTLKLQAVLGGAITTSQPEVTVDYEVYTDQGTTSKPASFQVALNSTTDVDILAAPTIQGYVNKVTRLSVYNKDTVNATVIIKTDDSGTEKIIQRVTLATLETLHFAIDSGFYTTAANGAIKNGAGVSGPATSTTNAVPRYSDATGTTLLNSAVTIDGSNNVAGVVALTMTGLLDISAAGAGQISFPATQNASAGANVLDDYEEGTFTPGIAGGSTAGTQTYSRQNGTYTKIGRHVTARSHTTMTAKDAATAGSLMLTGLPFTSSSTAGTTSALTIGYVSNFDFAAGYTQAGGDVPANSTQAELLQIGDNVAVAALAAGALNATSEIVATAIYNV